MKRLSGSGEFNTATSRAKEGCCYCCLKIAAASLSKSISIKTFKKQHLMNYLYMALGSYQEHYNIEVRKIKVLQYLAISPTGI